MALTYEMGKSLNSVLSLERKALVAERYAAWRSVQADSLATLSPASKNWFSWLIVRNTIIKNYNETSDDIVRIGVNSPAITSAC
jgi:hypothetical protein